MNLDVYSLMIAMLFIYIYASILGVGVRDPQILGSGGRGGVAGGSWTCLGKYYSLFCTESMLESGLFSRQRDKLTKNV